jgi:hypothetical protein
MAPPRRYRLQKSSRQTRHAGLRLCKEIGARKPGNPGWRLVFRRECALTATLVKPGFSEGFTYTDVLKRLAAIPSGHFVDNFLTMSDLRWAARPRVKKKKLSKIFLAIALLTVVSGCVTSDQAAQSSHSMSSRSAYVQRAPNAASKAVSLVELSKAGLIFILGSAY